MIVLDNNENIYTVIYLLPIPAAPAGNITQAVSSYPWLAGQTFTETFAYDSTNQLVSAANPQTYALSVTYGDWGKIQEYDLSQTDLANNLTTSQTRYYSYGSLNEGQTTFAPNNISYADGTNVNEQYGINGSLLKRETNRPGSPPETEHYRFAANGNLQAYMYENLLYVHYGYNAANTRTYKYSFDLNPNWVNGRLEAVNFNMHTAMFYPNAYINFNNNGYYTKHYYNGMERIASRLGDQNLPIHTHDPELQDRKDWQDSLIRKNIVEITGYEFLEPGEEQNHEDPKPVFELPQVGMNGLHPIGSGSVYYYHSNHLGSTCYVTDGNASVVQGFLYAPFGEITNEHNSSFGYSVIPKYSFNAKELDEETGMYYYEARYYAPPVFISRDVLFEEKPWFTPYHYCSNDPVGRIDPTGMMDDWYEDDDGNIKWTDCKSQNEMDEAGIKGTYLGEIVVLFEGSTKEKLGKNSYLNGDGADPAKVTVYGKSGCDDIGNYTGFTMTSDFEKYGAINDGYYDVVYDKDGKSGMIPSHYAVEGRKPVDCLFGKNNAYYNKVPNSYSKTQKNGIFVHRTNMDGFAGANVSTGCPLILGSQWNDFEKQIGQNGFKMIIRREHFSEHKCILK